MEGVAGRRGIAGRVGSTLAALAVDFGNRDLGLLGIARVGISYASWCLAIALVLVAASAAAAMDSDAWLVAILAGIFTAAISGYVPAESALLPALARSPQELSAANVTHSAMDNTGFLAAALTSGILLHTAGPATVFGVAAAVALITTAGLTLIGRDERPGYPADGELSGLVRRSALGFRTLLADKGLRLLGALLVV